MQNITKAVVATVATAALLVGAAGISGAPRAHYPKCAVSPTHCHKK